MMRSHSVVGVVVAVTVAVAVVAVVAVGCGSSSSGSPTDAVMPDTEETGSCSDQLSSLEAEMSAKLDVAAVDPNVTTDPDFTVMLERADGRRFVHSHGVSTETTRYESASTSKWVTATVIIVSRRSTP